MFLMTFNLWVFLWCRWWLRPIVYWVCGWWSCLEMSGHGARAVIHKDPGQTPWLHECRTGSMVRTGRLTTAWDAQEWRHRERRWRTDQQLLKKIQDGVLRRGRPFSPGSDWVICGRGIGQSLSMRGWAVCCDCYRGLDTGGGVVGVEGDGAGVRLSARPVMFLTRRRTNVVLMLGQRRRRWPNFKTTLCQALVIVE